MENEKTSRWLMSLTDKKKVFAMLIIAVSTLSSVIIWQSYQIKILYKDRKVFFEEREKQIVDCEVRAGKVRDIAAAALIIFMERNDSINRSIQKEYQALLLQRINKVTTYTENFKK